MKTTKRLPRRSTRTQSPRPRTQQLRSRTRHLGALLAVGAAAVLAFMLPAGAIPARRGTNLLHHVVRAVPRLSLLPHDNQYWHTDRNRILDEHNREVRIAGVNWSGFETRRGVPGGLTVQDYRAILNTIQMQGYNTVRLPLSNEMLEAPMIPEDIAFTVDGASINGDLQGLNSMQILDKIVAAAHANELKIILDDHRSEAGDSAEASGLWFTSEYSEDAWITDWVKLAKHFRGNPTVIGMDLRNEPHNASTTGACWDCGGDRDWHLAAQRAGNAVLHASPKVLIFVEGVDTYAGESSWWGGNLMGVRRSPVHLAVPGRLVYSAHVYGPSEYNQPWFNGSTSAASLRAIWRRQWAFVSEGGYAPVWIGEFGTPNTDADVRSSDPGSEGQWFSEIVRFLHEEPSLQWTYWGINGEDRYGLLDPQYGMRPANPLKAEVLATILPGHLDPAASSTAQPTVATDNRPVITVPSTALAVPEIHAPQVDSFADAARRDVERSLAVNASAMVSTRPEPAGARVPTKSEPPVAHQNGPAPEHPPAPKREVNNAVAADVQQAIAAAMHTAPETKPQ